MRSELRKQQETETVKLFDCNHFAHIIVLWQMQKFMCYCTVFALFHFVFVAISKYRLSGAYIRRVFFYVTSLGGLNLEGLIF